MSDTAQWWYEGGGQQLGPVPLETLQQLAASGELARTALVWSPGMTGWARADTVPALAWPVQPPPFTAPAPPPFAVPAPAAGAPWSPPVATTAAGAVGEPEEVSVGMTVLLTIVTLGVYGAVKFFQTGRAYERLAGRETRFVLYFWLCIGLGVASFFLNVSTGVLGFPLGLASVLFQFLALGEALRARREGLARWSLAPRVTADSTHWLFLGLGVGLSFVLVGFVFLVLQLVRWFEDWNAIRAAAIARG